MIIFISHVILQTFALLRKQQVPSTSSLLDPNITLTTHLFSPLWVSMGSNKRSIQNYESDRNDLIKIPEVKAISSALMKNYHLQMTVDK
jgi:hypothetical protein